MTFDTAHEVVGGFYTVPAEVRAMDSISGESTTFTAADVVEAITYAAAIIDDYTGASWVQRYQRDVLNGDFNTLALGFARRHNLAQAQMPHITRITHQLRPNLPHRLTSRLGQRLRGKRTGIGPTAAKIVYAHHKPPLRFPGLAPVLSVWPAH